MRSVLSARLFGALGVFFSSLLLVTGTLEAATVCVNPGGVGGCLPSIAAGIAAAGPGDTVNIAAGVYNETNILVNKPLIINGAGPAATIVNGGGFGEIFRISPPPITITGLAIRGGQRGINTNAAGCGGNLTLSNVLIADNSGGTGGGIFAGCTTLTVVDSFIVNNHAIGAPGAFGCDWGGGSGGGIAALCGGSVITIVDSTIAGNTATFVGAGIVANDTVLTISNSTISGNVASFGDPAAFNAGGGLFVGGGSPHVTIDHTTFAGNSAVDVASGIFGGPSTTLRASILADNGVECGPGLLLSSQGFNVLKDGSCGAPAPTDVFGVALLFPLADNGGRAPTHGLRAGSLALNRVPPPFCAPPVTDERRAPRPQLGACDSGAFEHGTAGDIEMQTLDLELAKIERAIREGTTTKACQTLADLLLYVSKDKLLTPGQRNVVSDRARGLQQLAGCF